jgi:hypothetical protein
MQYPVIKEHILLMSKLRINMLLLSIDPLDDDDGDVEYVLSAATTTGTGSSNATTVLSSLVPPSSNNKNSNNIEVGMRPSQVVDDIGSNQTQAEEDIQVAMTITIVFIFQFPLKPVYRMYFLPCNICIYDRARVCPS